MPLDHADLYFLKHRVIEALSQLVTTTATLLVNEPIEDKVYALALKIALDLKNHTPDAASSNEPCLQFRQRVASDLLVLSEYMNGTRSISC